VVNEKWTSETILALRQILDRRLDVNRNTYTTFIDLEKVFDKVNWRCSFRTLKDNEIDWRDRRLILKLYKAQTTIIDINGTTKQVKIRKGTGKDANYHHIYFVEASINERKSKTGGMKINGRRVHSIRFADDIVLLSLKII